MELRVHGIGGTSAASMVDEPSDAALVPRWPLPVGTVGAVWQGRRRDVLAYHWAPLTSGSRWFVLWPLAIPFTLLNVAGFMHPAGSVGRVLRGLHGVLCLVATSWFAVWLVFGGMEVAASKGWSSNVGLLLAAVVAAVVVVPSAFRCRWLPGRAPRGSARAGSLADPTFFHDGWALWLVHAATLLGTVGALWLRSEHDDRARTLALAARRSVVDVGAVLVALLVVMLVATLVSAASARERRPWQWTFAALGTIGVGASLIGGLMMSLLRVLVGSSLRGTPFVLYDVYGIALLVAIAVAGAAAVAILGRASPGELLDVAAEVLPDPISWFRARVALIPRALALALGAAVLTFVVVGTIAFVHRAPATVVEWLDRFRVPDGMREALQLPVEASGADAVREGTWTSGASPPVRIAHFAIYGLFVVMFVNLLKSYGAANSLRRIGSVWDVLTFWPRRYHPFAVRPYSACAVDQLRELLFTEVEEDWAEPMTVLAHSQGSMLVVAALAPGRAPGATTPSRSRVAHLVTVGSPLRALYMKAYPAYVGGEVVAQVAAALAPEGRWTNVFRFTDHVGRTAFSEERGWAPDTTPPAGEVQDRWWLDTDESTDCAIADPEARQGRVLGHNDYWEDPRVRKVVIGAPATGPEGR